MEKRCAQIELAKRKNEALPFVDKGLVRGVVNEILISNHRILSYPVILDQKEITAIERHLRRHHGDLADRVYFKPGALLPNSKESGTLIEIEKKRGRNRL